MSGIEEMQVIAALLKGGCTLLGQRIELAWPDGLPAGMTQEDLRAAAEQWGRDLEPRWILTASRLCDATMRCAAVLEDGACPVHGQRP